MSEVNAQDTTKINSADDVLHLYQGSGKDTKSGIEIEMSFYDPQDPDLAVMSLCQNKVLKNSAAAAMPEEDWVHNEPTSELLEVASKANNFANLRDVLKDTNDKVKILSDRASSLGLKRSYFQELPERTADDLLSRIVEVDRYRIMYAPYRADMAKCIEYFAVCKSNQVSVSVASADDMLKDIRRLYILAPFLFLLTDNSTGFNQGRTMPGNAAMLLRHEGLTEPRGERGYGFGDMPRYVFDACNGQEYMRAHIDHVMNNPLFMYYDLDGTLKGVPSGDWGVTFEALKERGLNTTSNYYLAQSTLWPDVKIAALKDAYGNVNGHRYEARMFGVGIHQHQTAFIATNALAFHEGFSASVDELLERYGFDITDPTDCYERVCQSYKAAREHNGQFMNVQYGTGTMLEFAREFGELMEDIAIEMDMEDELLPLLTICRTGCTDGKVNRKVFPTLEKVLDFQRQYDPQVFDNPNTCARLLFEKDHKSLFDESCSLARSA